MTQTPAPATREWLTQDMVMDRLHVSRRTVERYRKGSQPRLPTYRMPGGDPRFRAEDVDALMQPDTTTLEN